MEARSLLRRGGVRPVLAGLLLALAVQACGLGAAFSSPTQPGSGGSLTEAVVGTVGTLNPLFADNDNSRDADSLIYRGLITVDANEAVVPDLAKSLAVSPDQLSYTVTLRDDVKWADGVALAPADVFFTYSILQNPAYHAPGGQGWQDVAVSQAGDREVKFTLKAADSSFVFNLRQPIIPQHVFKDVPIPAMANDPASLLRGLGTGPFQVDSISKDRKVLTLKRNPNARPAPRLEHIVFRGYPTLGDAVEAVARGEADTVGALQPPQLAQLAKRPELNIQQMKTYSIVNVLYNRAGESASFFGSDAVRQALVMSVDRHAIVDGVLEGRADSAAGPIPPSDWAFSRPDAEKYSFDRNRAAQLLDAEGWKLTSGSDIRVKGGREFSVTLTTADAYPYAQVADALSKQLRQVGVDVKIDPVPASVLLGRLLQTQYQLALVGFDLGPDPDQSSLWHSNAPAGSLNFANPRLLRQALIDKDLDDARTVGDHKARRKVYADFQDLMSDAAPAIFLFQPHYAYVLAKRVHGIRTNPVIDPADRFQFASEWWVSKTA